MDNTLEQLSPAARATRAAGPLDHVLALLLALLSGPLGIMGAGFQELMSGGGIGLPFIGAPIIEETLKPVGVYILLIHWPHVRRSQLYIALLAALSGLGFALIESLVYVTVYVPDHSASFVVYRFTFGPAVHVTASFIVGLGISQRLFDWARGNAPLPKASRNFYIAAMTLHGIANTVVIALAIAGVLDV